MVRKGGGRFYFREPPRGSRRIFWQFHVFKSSSRDLQKGCYIACGRVGEGAVFCVSPMSGGG